MKKSIVFFLCLTFYTCAYLQCQAQDSSRLRISLLTCSPGGPDDELYSTFGHSALRITDSNSVTDMVYNYGTFNFNEQGFYVKFIRGKLNYELSIDEFSNFKFEYQAANRVITEQVLELSGEEKQHVRRAINENLKEENRHYLYDFFLDNCTTRLRDIIIRHKKVAPRLPFVMPANFTFRNAIHQYLEKNKKYWSKLGIDILLGAPTDAVMTAAQQEFLPDNLMNALDAVKNVPVVKPRQNLFQVSNNRDNPSWLTPAVLFSLILIFYFLLSLVKTPVIVSIVKKLDFLLFFLTGLLGILLIFMWTGTDHSMTKNNYNLLWAWPAHIIYAFLKNNNRLYVKLYAKLAAIFICLLLLTWAFLPQQMNNALLPIVLLLGYRLASFGFGKT